MENFPTKFLGQVSSLLSSSNEELMPILLKNFQKLEGEETFTRSFYEASITLIKTLINYYKKGKLQTNVL